MELSLMEGVVYRAKLFFYKGVLNSRALVQDATHTEKTFVPQSFGSIEEGMAYYRERMGQNPFAQHTSLCLFLTLTGGRPCNAFVIISEGEWRLISIWYDGHYRITQHEYHTKEYE